MNESTLLEGVLLSRSHVAGSKSILRAWLTPISRPKYTLISHRYTYLFVGKSMRSR